MIIVVEGPDNAGKTTLALDVAKAIKAVFIKAERPSSGVVLNHYQNILEVARHYSGYVVTDRHVAISEPIYGTIIRGRHDLLQSDIVRSLARVQGVIYCRPPSSMILGSIDFRPQMEGVVANAEAIVNAYDFFFGSWKYPAPLVKYDWTQGAHTVSSIIDWVRRLH